MIEKRRLKFVRSILGGNVAFKSCSELYRLQIKDGNVVLSRFDSGSLNGILAIKENEHGTQTQRRIQT